MTYHNRWCQSECKGDEFVQHLQIISKITTSSFTALLRTHANAMENSSSTFPTRGRSRTPFLHFHALLSFIHWNNSQCSRHSPNASQSSRSHPPDRSQIYFLRLNVIYFKRCSKQCYTFGTSISSLWSDEAVEQTLNAIINKQSFCRPHIELMTFNFYFQRCFWQASKPNQIFSITKTIWCIWCIPPSLLRLSSHWLRLWNLLSHSRGVQSTCVFAHKM